MNADKVTYLKRYLRDMVSAYEHDYVCDASEQAESSERYAAAVAVVNSLVLASEQADALRNAVEAMRVSGGKVEFQKQFDAAKTLAAQGDLT